MNKQKLVSNGLPMMDRTAIAGWLVVCASCLPVGTAFRHYCASKRQAMGGGES